MPTDQLAQRDGPIERAIHRILGGDPLSAAATTSGLAPDDLGAAVEIYRTAGCQALAEHRATSWRQLYLRFADWQQADQIAAAHLLPLLDDAEKHGQISAWWFMRKHPCWRLRLHPTRPDPSARIETALDQLAADGHLDAWWPGIYEPETAAFGGGVAMDIAHALFTADSRGVLELSAASGTGLGRRELSLLLVSALARGAGLEWYERGDLFDRVCAERPLPHDVPAEKLTALTDTLATLLRADTAADGSLFGPDGPVAAQTSWATACATAGRALTDASRTGQLRRGLRDILSYHVIFHWNRLGLPARAQALLAHAARQAILGPRVRAWPAPSQLAPAPELDVDQLLSRFPLVLHGRLHCPDLASRVARVEELADSAAQHADLDDRVNAACAAWNLAALIAADCDLPDLAADLCHQQFDILQAAWPVAGRVAIASLQPLINLARLDERAGNPLGAFHTLSLIDSVARTGGTADLAGRTIDFARFLAPSGDHDDLDAFLRRVLREEGTRVLAAAGHWPRTVEHATRYDDLPHQLREARQARIVAAALDRRFDEATRLVDTAETPELWEQAVTACLRAYLAIKTGQVDAQATVAVITMVQRARGSTTGGTTVFQIKLGLTAIDLIAATHPRDGSLLAAELAADAHRSASAYAARELLDHPTCRALLPPAQTAELHALVTGAGLRTETIPDDLRGRIHQATDAAARVLNRALRPDGTASVSDRGRRSGNSA